jgi:hypothetical protein
MYLLYKKGRLQIAGGSSWRITQGVGVLDRGVAVNVG